MSGKVIICFVLAVVGSAQQVGHYLQGATGLNSATPLPPGGYLTYFPYLSRITAVKGPEGNTIVPANINVWANMAVATFMVPNTAKGVSFGFSVIAPWMSQRLQGDILPIDKRTTGYSDTFVTPVILGYTKGATSIYTAYSFVAPTGQFNPTSPANPGLGMWSHIFQLGTTVNFGSTKMWNASAMSSWEITSNKKGIDVQVGPSMTLEYGFGRRFLKGALNVGAAGHYYQKLEADSGADIRPIVRGLKDRALGLGPEVQLILPPARVAFTFRYEPQFGVRNRTRSDIFVVNLTYLGMLH